MLSSTVCSSFTDSGMENSKKNSWKFARPKKIAKIL